MAGNYFRQHLRQTDHRTLIKMDHYLRLYGRLMRRYRGRTVRFLEIGIFRGGSIPMWQGFFAPDSHLVFADIDPGCRNLAGPGVHIEIGDQADPAFLDQLARQHGPFDIIVDDGGHLMYQQIASLNGLWPHLADGGLYVVEDTHTSYWPGFGGGLRVEGSFIEHAKRLIDAMHSWYTDDDQGFPLDPLAREIGSVQFYDSLTVIEKLLHDAPVWLSARNGEITRDSTPLQRRNRTSVFPDPRKAAPKTGHSDEREEPQKDSATATAP